MTLQNSPTTIERTTDPENLGLASFPEGFRALVIGASGGLGAAFVDLLRQHPRCGEVQAMHRGSTPAIDFADESSIARAAQMLSAQPPFHLVLCTAGVLHTPDFLPEKRLEDLHYAQLLQTFTVNTFGPALLLRHCAPLLDRQRSVMALLSARVGSIGDNRLGGWYSYRASKAALNMLVKTAAIEVMRKQPNAVLVALHPGTVDTALSAPFKGAQIGRPANVAATQMLQTLDRLRPEDSGSFIAYDGARVPW